MRKWRREKIVQNNGCKMMNLWRLRRLVVLIKINKFCMSKLMKTMSSIDQEKRWSVNVAHISIVIWIKLWLKIEIWGIVYIITLKGLKLMKILKRILIWGFNWKVLKIRSRNHLFHLPVWNGGLKVRFFRLINGRKSMGGVRLRTRSNLGRLIAWQRSFIRNLNLLWGTRSFQGKRWGLIRKNCWVIWRRRFFLRLLRLWKFRRSIELPYKWGNRWSMGTKVYRKMKSIEKHLFN